MLLGKVLLAFRSGRDTQRISISLQLIVSIVGFEWRPKGV